MKDIIGYEGLSAITSCGKVYSYRTKKFLKLQKRKDGYLQVDLRKNGEKKKYLVHRLVAEAYLPNHNNLPYVNHKDENKENNALQNLEWCTQKYNANYGSRNQKMSKPVYCIELDKTFDGASAAARELGLDNSHIIKCCKGKQKITGGYHWRYQEVDSNVKT